MVNNIEKQLKEISERLEQGVKEIFTSERYTEYLNTIAKLESLKKDADFYYALFSENGFDEKIPRDQNSCYLYSLGEIVKNDF